MPLRDDMKLISVDDHLIEPPDVWEERLPARYKEKGPRLIELPEEVVLHNPRPDGATKVKAEVTLSAGSQTWVYENKPAPDLTMNAVAGIPPDKWQNWRTEPRRYDYIRAGCMDPAERLKDMDEDGVHAQTGFPSWPNFAGTRFLQSEDMELAHLCVQAYNDWVVDEWVGEDPARFIPVIILPLWDQRLCIAEIERTAGKGAKAISFPEDPSPLGLPSLHSREWDSVFAAAQDTDMALCMHFGTSGTIPQVSPGGSPMVTASIMGMNSMKTAAELLFSHILHEYPRLRVSLAEGGLGWVPWLLQRVDSTWHKMRYMHDSYDVPPSEIWHRNFYACGIDDEAGIALRHEIGVEHTCLESDYPHLDTSWPNTRKRASEMLADVPDEEAHKIAELNARRLFRHDG